MSSPDPVTLAGASRTRDDLLFDQFLAELAHAQLAEWLPAEPSRILDVSRHSSRLIGLMLERGHTVVHADPQATRLDIPGPDAGARLLTVQGDARSLHWVADESVDAVVAEGGVLSEALAAEITIEDVHRVLRPGGRLLMCVDSLVSGLSRLADQGRWAELADVPSADVVLVPTADGGASRCFWPEELHGMLAETGFAVDWVRPRTVLAEETVVHALRVQPHQLPSLVATELALSHRRQGESVGARLVASASRL